MDSSSQKHDGTAQYSLYSTLGQEMFPICLSVDHEIPGETTTCLVARCFNLYADLLE